MVLLLCPDKWKTGVGHQTGMMTKTDNWVGRAGITQFISWWVNGKLNRNKFAHQTGNVMV